MFCMNNTLLMFSSIGRIQTYEGIVVSYYCYKVSIKPIRIKIVFLCLTLTLHQENISW